MLYTECGENYSKFVCENLTEIGFDDMDVPDSCHRRRSEARMHVVGRAFVRCKIQIRM